MKFTNSLAFVRSVWHIKARRIRSAAIREKCWTLHYHAMRTGLGQYSARRTAATSAMRKPDANRVLLIFYGLVEEVLGRNEYM